MLIASSLQDWPNSTVATPQRRVFVPYEYRPVSALTDTPIPLDAGDAPGSYYVDGNKVVAIYCDEIVEFHYTNPNFQARQIALLQSAGVRKVDFVKGTVRLFAVLIALLLLTQILLWVTT